MEEVLSNLAQIQDKIASAAQRVGRKPEDARLVAISKKKSADHIRAAMDAGQQIFGENLVQEAQRKKEELPGSIEWHLVGHLQKNKVRGALETFDLIHSIDSLALAERVQRLAEEPGFRPRVLLQVNVAGEASKHGFSPDALRAEFEQLLELHRLEIEGLMTIPPFAAQPEDSRQYFVQLRELRDSLQDEFQAGLPELSMGMSGDYEVAVEEGATLVRVGQAIFGERKKK
jgi:hypothetical protein